MDLLTSNLDKIIGIGLLFFMSLYLRFILQIMGQAWIKTIAHTATLTILPIITYVIVNVISGNIALSLGMVGALSIVRFRNPVRSPLELSIYFGAITMGIAAAVSLMWLALLVGSVTLVSIGLCLVSFLTKFITGKPFFIASFTEGNSLSILQVSSKKDINLLDIDNALTSKSTTPHEVSYTLASSDFERLKEIETSVNSIEGIISSQLNR